MSFEFHPEAEDELGSAIEYYEEIEKGLGSDFAIEVYSAIQRSVAHPKAWSILEGEVRRIMVRRFPYGILYSEEKNGLYILGVMHLHRDPEYWKKRR